MSAPIPVPVEREGNPPNRLVIERLLFLRSDPRDLLDRMLAIIHLAARGPWFLDKVTGFAVDLSDDDWLTLFVTGAYLPSLRTVDTAMAGLRAEPK